MVEENRSTQEKAEESKFLAEPVKIKDYVLMMILSLEVKAWAYLDLVAHPETQKHKKDLAEAKLAIDVIDSLYKYVEGQLTSEEKKDLQVRLTNLRLNFVNQK